MDILERSARLWSGEEDLEGKHAWSADNTLHEAGEGIAFVHSFANASVLRTSDGLMMVDTGGFLVAQEVHRLVRAWSALPLKVAVYSHGHIDHVFGVPHFEADQEEPVEVIAHRGVARRFARYEESPGYNGLANSRQFQLPGLQWPTDYRYPDTDYEVTYTSSLGELYFELHHARGETDDHTWTHFPDRRVIACGDLFAWVTPNGGNPQKVQRYPRDWAVALEEMAALEAELLLPGHGLPLAGKERIAITLRNAAALLRSIFDQTLEMMNAGAPLNEILHSVKAPEELINLPYLRPVYDEPEFIVHNVWREFGGWYGGDPSELKPANKVALAREILSLVSEKRAYYSRVEELSDSPAEADQRLAGHLAELAYQADVLDPDARALRARVFRRRASLEMSLMSKGIFNSAAMEAEAQPEKR
ncbi:MAG: MBL fold metallo-hydrolase [Actinomycetota bacterium]|nr:MBL fold metallo-hydrolase [Actinomycetota bacterium]